VREAGGLLVENQMAAVNEKPPPWRKPSRRSRKSTESRSVVTSASSTSLRQVSVKRDLIHTLGLKGHKASFMPRLAKENGGTCVSR